MKAKEFNELMAKEGMSNSKYNNKIKYVDGIRFDSQLEADRYCHLLILQRAGELSDLKLQVPYELIPKQDGQQACIYKADFTYIVKGKLIVEDVKGHKTEVYNIKKKLMQYVYGIKIKEVKKENLYDWNF